MEFKKCERCGCFFTSVGDTCINCSPKDRLEMNKLKNFLEGTHSVAGINMDSISYNTGITIKNLNRFLGTDEFSATANELGLINKANGKVKC